LPDQLFVEIGRMHHHLVLAQYNIRHACHVLRIPNLMMDSVVPVHSMGHIMHNCQCNP
jgi:hypothetical protein